ncbi:MAG: hypothetical protein JWO87_1373 [Phycisphaerales bacterium]|nr:hypothetical protein [Phycisphaerales bacterium]
MIRAFILTCVWHFLLATGALAAEPAEYSVSAQGVRTGDKVSVAIELSHTKAGGEVVDGHRVTGTNRSARIMLSDGKRASLIGNLGDHSPQQPAAPVGPGEPKSVQSLDDMESGFRVDVISIKGMDKVLITASVVEKGAAVWADSKMIEVKVKPESGRK